MYQVLIVDDEFLARKLLQSYVAQLPQLQLAGSCSNAIEAFQVIQQQPIDILLLDIHMPDLNGLDFARTLQGVPAITFTTAYSEYAQQSYEVSAGDYLLKPIAQPRFVQAIEKAMRRVDSLRPAQTAATPDAAAPVSPAPEASATNATYMMVKADYKLYKINYADLLYVEGQHEYVSFYTTGKRITALYSLKSLEESLPRGQFVRVHKSYIVAIAQISEVDQASVTVAGTKIPIGGSYREVLNQALGIKS